MIAQILGFLPHTRVAWVEFLGSLLLPGPALAVVDVWGVNQSMEDFSFPLFLLNE